jgi:hypothetical protein
MAVSVLGLIEIQLGRTDSGPSSRTIDDLDTGSRQRT